jgi:hypothetical protein
VDRTRKTRNAYRILVKKATGKHPVGTPRRKWETDLREIGCKYQKWMQQVWNHVQWQAFILATKVNLQFSFHSDD